MQVLQLLDQHKAVERAYERANSFSEKARGIILTFPENAAQRALLAVVDLVTERAS